jgi:hypothetical protein
MAFFGNSDISELAACTDGRPLPPLAAHYMSACGRPWTSVFCYPAFGRLLTGSLG